MTSDCEIGLHTKFRENLSGSSKVEMWYTDTVVSHKLVAFFVLRKESMLKLGRVLVETIR